MKAIRLVTILMLMGAFVACAPDRSSSDVQRDRQEKVVAEGVAQVGMPSIKNFREYKLLKELYELRDQEGLITYTYLENAIPTIVPGHTVLGGKLTYLGQTIGYGIPAATQFSAPESMQRWRIESSGKGEGKTYGVERLPQPEPNGLFSPSSTEATWVFLKDPSGDKVLPFYEESRISVSPFKLPFDK